MPKHFDTDTELAELSRLAGELRPAVRDRVRLDVSFARALLESSGCSSLTELQELLTWMQSHGFRSAADVDAYLHTLETEREKLTREIEEKNANRND
jgi:hypothetical protein